MSDVIQIDTTNICNANCTFCFRDKLKFKQGIMDIGVFKRIVDDNPSTYFVLCAFGEPLCDPFIVERIEYIRARYPEAWISLNTNGQLLTEDKILALRSAGISERRLTKTTITSIFFQFLQANIRLKTSRCGYMTYEDFCPISDTEALIVTGAEYTALTDLKKVGYELDEGRVKLTSIGETLVKGTHLRLGNLINGVPIYSDNGDMLFLKGEQPYSCEIGFLYKKEGKIWLNEKVLIEKWGEYLAIGRPTYYNGLVYFEARKEGNSITSPLFWEIWTFNPETKEKRFVRMGANPYCYEGKLFYQKWEGGKFETFYCDISW